RFEPVLLVEGARAAVLLEHIQGDPARQILKCPAQQCSAYPASLARRIDEKLIDMPVFQRDEPGNWLRLERCARPGPLVKFAGVPCGDLFERIGPGHETIRDQTGAVVYEADLRDIRSRERTKCEGRDTRVRHPRCFLKNSIARFQASSAACRSCTDMRCSLAKACSASYR